MQQRTFHRRFWLSRWLLAALLLQSYIPSGFMPVRGAAFRLELCPAAAGMPSALLHAHHRHAGGGDYEACPFGSAPAGGPLSQLVIFTPPAPIGIAPSRAFAPTFYAFQPDRAHLPRGPPRSVDS